MLYWISNPLWVGGSLSVGAIAAIKLLWFGSLSYKFGGSNVSDAIIEMVIALAFIWGTTWCAIMSLRFGKWLSSLYSSFWHWSSSLVVSPKARTSTLLTRSLPTPP